MYDFVGDAIAAVEYLQHKSYINNIIPMGHSQGAGIAPYVASFMNLTTAVSLMGAGTDIDYTLKIQEIEAGFLFYLCVHL